MPLAQRLPLAAPLQLFQRILVDRLQHHEALRAVWPFKRPQQALVYQRLD
jgi:hypothetical protein